MDSEGRKLDVFFFPFVGGGHLIPMIDLARLFASHGVKSTIVTTPNEIHIFHKSIERDRKSGRDVNLHTLSLPPGEELTAVDLSAHPFTDTSVLEQPLKQLLVDRRPDCIVTDTFHQWAADAVDSVGVKRIIFNGNCCFTPCCDNSLTVHSPHEKVSSDSEPFVLPGLPDRIELTRSQLPIFIRTGTEFPGKSMRAELNSYGKIVNSFYDLEPSYADYFRNKMGKKAWIVGPVSLCNRNVEDKAERGQKAVIDEISCLTWLDSKRPNSVVYLSFGSAGKLPPQQIHEIACGLEASEQSFIWVVGKFLDEGEWKNCLPIGFEEKARKENKGLVIRGWAPQLLILEHKAVGGFVTHCGWNSTLECICAGVPMVTWPLSAEQFYNEKLVTEVLKIGIRVGSEEWTARHTERKTLVGREKVEVAVKRLLDGGNEAAAMRRRAEEMAVKAKRAVEEDGSSYNDVEALIAELKSCPKERVDVTGKAE